jgi:hypothetical protein
MMPLALLQSSFKSQEKIMFEELNYTLENVGQSLSRFKSERKKISDRHLFNLIAQYDKLAKKNNTDALEKLKSSGEWFIATQPAKRRFMFWHSIEQLKARVCADIVELSVIAERVQWKEVQLWRS